MLLQNISNFLFVLPFCVTFFFTFIFLCLLNAVYFEYECLNDASFTPRFTDLNAHC